MCRKVLKLIGRALRLRLAERIALVEHGTAAQCLTSPSRTAENSPIQGKSC